MLNQNGSEIGFKLIDGALKNGGLIFDSEGQELILGEGNAHVSPQSTQSQMVSEIRINEVLHGVESLIRTVV